MTHHLVDQNARGDDARVAVVLAARLQEPPLPASHDFETGWCAMLWYDSSTRRKLVASSMMSLKSSGDCFMCLYVLTASSPPARFFHGRRCSCRDFLCSFFFGPTLEQKEKTDVAPFLAMFPHCPDSAPVSEPSTAAAAPERPWIDLEAGQTPPRAAAPTGFAEIFSPAAWAWRRAPASSGLGSYGSSTRTGPRSASRP